MLSVFFRKIPWLLFTLWISTLVAFSLIRLAPGDPIELLLGERGGSPELVAQFRSQWALNQPLWKQYAQFLKQLSSGNLGTSIVSRRPVWEEIRDRFPATLELSLCAILFAFFVGIPLGILAALKRNTFWDYTCMGVSLGGYSMPIFWWGMLLIFFFSVFLGWTPVSGRMDVLYEIPRWSGFYLIDSWRSVDAKAAFWQALRHLILPAFALGTIPLAVLARMTRSSVLEVFQEPYLQTARAKGLPRWKVIWVHALRAALVPILTVFGLLVSQLMTGAVLTETIFSWPGIGRWFVLSVSARDYPSIQGGIVFFTFSVSLVNFLTDMVSAWFYPPLREEMHQ